ncbi:MAG: VOC family protein [Planctomyces sp.]|nr:VOC family protein [Planctomyces sp.]
MRVSSKITPCLWFDNQAEEAAQLYVDVFPDSKISGFTRYGEEGKEIHGRPAGSVLTVDFELSGQPFTALNGGPMFKLNEAVSFQVSCETQAEIDRFWDRLGEGGDPAAQQCGWLKDRFGLSWQIVPAELSQLLGSVDSAQGQRVMKALLQMQKLDLDELRRAARG